MRMKAEKSKIEAKTVNYMLDLCLKYVTALYIHALSYPSPQVQIVVGLIPGELHSSVGHPQKRAPFWNHKLTTKNIPHEHT